MSLVVRGEVEGLEKEQERKAAPPLVTTWSRGSWLIRGRLE